ncbi:transposase [Streptomyces vietnamensis]|uniref:transposase n=1 Tax=Streptomyces vietnamensis TaxID=362257 RepID=UPI00343D398C
MPSRHASSRCCRTRTPKRGGRWRDHRQVIDAIAFKYRTGTPWMDLPEHFGSWKRAHNRLRKWAADGTWEKVFTALLVQADAEGDLDWFIRHHPESAHRHIGEITREAHARWEIPAEDTLYTLHQAVAVDGKLSKEDAQSFFALLTPPAKND